MSVSEGFYANPPSSQINVDAEYDEIKQKFNSYYESESLNTTCTVETVNDDCVPGSICESGVCAPDFASSEANVKNKLREYKGVIDNNNASRDRIVQKVDDNMVMRDAIRNNERYRDFDGDWLDYLDDSRMGDTTTVARRDVNAMVMHNNNNYVLALVGLGTVALTSYLMIRR